MTAPTPLTMTPERQDVLEFVCAPSGGIFPGDGLIFLAGIAQRQQEVVQLLRAHAQHTENSYFDQAADLIEQEEPK